MNRWMNDPQYLAQIGHFLGGAMIVLLFALFCTWPAWYAFMGIVLWAGVKEFWYDMRYELPRQTWGMSGEDFVFWLFGGLAGLGVNWLVLHYGRHCI